RLLCPRWRTDRRSLTGARAPIRVGGDVLALQFTVDFSDARVQGTLAPPFGDLVLCNVGTLPLNGMTVLQWGLRRSDERPGKLRELRAPVRDQRSVVQRYLHLRRAQHPLWLAVQSETLPVRRRHERRRQLRDLRACLLESRLLRGRVPVGRTPSIRRRGPESW